PAISAAIEAKTAPPFVPRDRTKRNVWQEEQRFYKQRGARPAWSDGSRLASSADALARAIRAADQDGLDPADYGADSIDALRGQRLDPAKAAEADLRLTYAYLSYAWDLSRGSTMPESLDPQWHASPRDLDFSAALQEGLDRDRIEESLARLAPQAPQYVGLKQ